MTTTPREEDTTYEFTPPLLAWQSISKGFPVTRAARFGDGWLILCLPDTRGSGNPHGTVAPSMVYVPDIQSGLERPPRGRPRGS